MRICYILVCLAWPQLLIAQVGLGTNVAQVTLVARVAPRASIEAVSPAREAGHEGLVREASVKVRLTANTGYRLVVWGTEAGNWGGHRGSRLWVRDADGHFQELASGSFVTAAQDARASGSEEHDVRFRIEGDSVDGAGESMPVRYEIVISPTI